MQYIESDLKNQKPIKKIDLETVFANVYGRTLFSIFFEFPELAAVISKMLS
jgi:fluoride ion exporter CrcB/FEX